jgi:DNA-binding NarL/FixJ family response regulator
VLRHVAQGESNKQIARALGISKQTVKNHMWAIFQKLGVQDRTGAVIVALQSGELEIPGVERVR